MVATPACTQRPSFNRVLALLLMATIFWGSSIPGDEIHLPAWWNLDKLLHCVEYAVLGLALVRSMPLGMFAKWQWLAAASAGALYGLSDEWHQAFVLGRVPSAADAAADAFGAAVGSWLWLWLWLKQKQDQNQSDGACAGSARS